MNRFHGPTHKGDYSYEHHQVAHIHALTESQINIGNYEKPKVSADTTEYYDFNSAILYFCKYCGIINHDRYFYHCRQIEFKYEGD